MRRAVFPGSFDPVTVGHMDLIKRAAGMFEEVVIGVLRNTAKQPLCTVEERVALLNTLVKDLQGVQVAAFDGMLIDFVRERKACAVIRGLRTAADFEYELPLAQTNRHLEPDADTVFLAASPEHSYISSSGVKEILQFGGDITGLVPREVEQFLQQSGRRGTDKIHIEGEGIGGTYGKQ